MIAGLVPALTAVGPAPRDGVYYRRGPVVLRAERVRARRPSGGLTPYRLAGYRLYWNGRRTDVRFGPEEIDASPSTEITAHRTRGGIMYGTVFRIVSGATLTSGTYAFLGERGRQMRVAASQVQANGERLLFYGNGGETEALVGRPLLYTAGRLREIGHATKVHLESNGRVTGWTLVDAGDRPYEPGFETRGPLYRRYFVWHDGRRVPKGRELDR